MRRNKDVYVEQTPTAKKLEETLHKRDENRKKVREAAQTIVNGMIENFADPYDDIDVECYCEKDVILVRAISNEFKEGARVQRTEELQNPRYVLKKVKDLIIQDGSLDKDLYYEETNRGGIKLKLK